MMVYLSAQTMKKNMAKFGFKTYDNEVLSFFNESLYNFMLKSLQKNSTKGGRVLLPPEYFGIDSGKYIDTPTHTDMNISTDFIRPPMSFSGANAVSGGGSAGFKVSKASVNAAASEAANRLGVSDWQKKSLTIERLQQRYEGLMSELLQKAMKKSKGSDNLDSKLLQDLAKSRKYNIIH